MAFVALRLVIGWHFFDEGRGKLLSGGFSSSPFFQQAKGPLAAWYHSLSGYKSSREWLDLAATENGWKNYRQRVERKYRFDSAQAERSDKILDQHIKLLRGHFRAFDDEIKRCVNSYAAIDEAEADESISALPSMQVHSDRNRTELAEITKDVVPPVQNLWRSLELQLLNLRTDDQKGHADLSIMESNSFFSRGTIDRIVPYFTLAVGALLLVGLFSHTAALAGAAFLLLVVSTQPPWVAGSSPAHSQLIELCGLLVIAGTGAGRIAGLDFFLDAWRRKRQSVQSE